MFQLVRGYRDQGMTAYAELQEAEFAAESTEAAQFTSNSSPSIAGFTLRRRQLGRGAPPDSHRPIRIAGGGRDLYDRLAKEGRVATQGILFATNSDRIRPESTPTLEEIGTLLKDHPDLWIAIEGHTDSDGEDVYNRSLSERRAAAVKAFLVETYAIADGRLQTAGFGESRPVADNATPEGKQQNRRVELVRLEQ